MNFIERMFHIAPDHGSGTLEIAILTVLAVSLIFAISLVGGRLLSTVSRKWVERSRMTA